MNGFLDGFTVLVLACVLFCGGCSKKPAQKPIVKTSVQVPGDKVKRTVTETVQTTHYEPPPPVAFTTVRSVTKTFDANGNEIKGGDLHKAEVVQPGKGAGLDFRP